MSKDLAAAQAVVFCHNMPFDTTAAPGTENGWIAGAKSRVLRPETWDARIRVGYETFGYWYFGSPAEMVVGDWRIEAVKGKDVLCRVGFEVVSPAKLPRRVRKQFFAATYSVEWRGDIEILLRCICKGLKPFASAAFSRDRSTAWPMTDNLLPKTTAPFWAICWV